MTVYPKQHLNGSRYLKIGSAHSSSSINSIDDLTGIHTHFDRNILYISPEMTAERTRYFKHIFAGSERIATKRGEGFSVNLPAESNEVENDQGFDWMNELEQQAMWFNPQADIVNPDAHPGVIRNYAHKLG